MNLTDGVFAQLAGILNNLCQEIEALHNIRLSMADWTNGYEGFRTYFLQIPQNVDNFLPLLDAVCLDAINGSSVKSNFHKARKGFACKREDLLDFVRFYAQKTSIAAGNYARVIFRKQLLPSRLDCWRSWCIRKPTLTDVFRRSPRRNDGAIRRISPFIVYKLFLSRCISNVLRRTIPSSDSRF